MKTKRKIFWAFILNLVFSIFEFISGIFTGSIAIASDAVHDFGDALSIGLSYAFEKKSEKKPNDKYTYGYARFSVLGGLISTLVLFISSFILIYNAVLKIITPTPINYNAMIIIAIIGFSVNLVAARITHGGHSVNQKAINLHLFEDVFGWLIVLIGAIFIKFTNFYIIDPILSIVLALIILYNSSKNLKQILDIFLLKTPSAINVLELKSHIKNIDSVIDVHHIHVWTIDGQRNFATLHVVTTTMTENLKRRIKQELNHHGILHVTIEMETQDANCLEKECYIHEHIPHCHCQHHHA